MGEYVTLADLRITSGDDVSRNVIDEFIKSSFLLSAVPFHQAAAETGGAALAYTYTRLKTQPTAAFRALNEDYTAQAVDTEQFTVVCKPLGGTFKVDRALGATNSTQVALQVSQKVKAAAAAWSDAAINGDSDAITGNEDSFDGLSVALTGSSTEIDGSDVDMSAVSSEADALTVLEAFDAAIAELDSDQNVVILTNKKGRLKLQNVARRGGYLTHSESAAGTKISTYAGIPIVDLGAKAGSNDPIIPVASQATDFYVVRFAEDGFHGVAPANKPLISTYLPDFTRPEAVHTGAVEIMSTVALKSTKAAVVLRDVVIEAAPAGP